MLPVRRHGSLWCVLAFALVAAGGAPSTAVADACSAADTPIGRIQGTSDRAAVTGVQTLQGVVVADFEFAGNGSGYDHLRGFYVQDLPGTDDGDPLSSDAIFVYSGQADHVALGQLVQVTGEVVEYAFGGSPSTLTEITRPTIELCASDASIEPVAVTLPLPDAKFLERYEGMLVRLPQKLFVTEHFQLGRFGQLVLSSGGRLRQPTHIAEPGTTADAQRAANALNRIALDDALQAQNPDPIAFGLGGRELTAGDPLRAGDSVTGVVGVLTQTDATSAPGVPPESDPVLYRVRPFQVLHAQPPTFVAENKRPTLPLTSEGAVHVASVNLLNYFNTFGASACSYGVGGASAECRGADNADEFARQWPKTVQAILGTAASIVVLNELENDGYGQASALQDLVDKLNAATAPGSYGFIDVDARTGQTNALGQDAIRVALLYKPREVRPVGATAVLNSGAFGIYQTQAGAMQRNRPALAQAFEVEDAGRLIVVGNHFKSKGSSCADNLSPVGPDPDAHDGQGECNLTRTAAAEQLVSWLASDPTGTGERKQLVMGDFNAYAREAPIARIVRGGFTDLVDRYIGAEAYSYAFDGQWGYLDHALASASLLEHVRSVVELHIAADEPVVLDYNTNFKRPGQLASLYASDAFRASDHDPVVVGLTFHAPGPPAPPAWSDWHIGLIGLLLVTGGLLVARRRPRWRSQTVEPRGLTAC